MPKQIKKYILIVVSILLPLTILLVFLNLYSQQVKQELEKNAENNEKGKEKKKVNEDKEWQKIEKQFEEALKANDKSAIENLAINIVEYENVERSINLLISGLRKINDLELYWYIIKIMSEFETTGEKKPYDILLKKIITEPNSDIQVDLFNVLLWSSDKEAENAICKLLDEGNVPLKLLALDRLKRTKDKDSLIPKLIDILAGFPKNVTKKEDLVYKSRVVELLEDLSGRWGLTVEGWRHWWQNYIKRKKEGDIAAPVEEPKKNEVEKYQENLPAIMKDKKRWETVTKGAAGEIWVHPSPRGYDNIEVLLEKLGVKFKTFVWQELTKREVKKELFEQAKVLLFNCGVATINNEVASIIKEFVRKGGYLFAEDYGLKDVLLPVFGNEFLEKKETIKEGSTTFYMAKGLTAHPLLRDTFLVPFQSAKENPYVWKIDPATYAFEIKKPQRVLTLVSAYGLSEEQPLAVTFNYPGLVNQAQVYMKNKYEDPLNLNGGRVLFVLGHFGKQNAAADNCALHQLVLNFIYEAKSISIERARRSTNR